jgi:hypothetical protein
MRLRIIGFGFLLVVMLASSACDIAGRLLPGGNSRKVGELWSDVPAMPGLSKASTDMPIPVRLAVQAYFQAAGEGTGSIDFIAFTTSQTPADVQAFYTRERMVAAGWNGTDAPGCVADPSGTMPGGAVCIFGKQSAGGATTMLAVVTSVDDKAKLSNVYFSRIDLKAKPTPKPSSGG